MSPLANLAFIFFLYNVLGWIVESIVVSVASRKWINRGFLASPMLPIYGSGVLVMLVCLTPIKELGLFVEIFGREINLAIVLVVIGGVVLCDLLEFVTSYVMEKIFHARWWDYSGKFCNLQGRICLEHSCYWAFSAWILLYVIHPFTEKTIELIPVNYQYFALGIALAVFVIDFLHSVKSASNIRAYMDKINAKIDKMQAWAMNEGVAGEQLVSDMNETEDFIAEQSQELDDWKSGTHLTDRAKKTTNDLAKRMAQMFYSYPNMQKHTYNALEKLRGLLNDVGERIVDPSKSSRKDAKIMMDE
ncbi:MAG: putative ABC transporter permease [Oscillospiraceae bacterium]|nr:putative ABC transporter permease [Oscillospiraceae bacterium]